MPWVTGNLKECGTSGLHQSKTCGITFLKREKIKRTNKKLTLELIQRFQLTVIVLVTKNYLSKPSFIYVHSFTHSFILTK